MSAEKKGGRRFKREVIELLGSQDLDRALDALCQLPARQVINPLLSILPSTDPVKWTAVAAMGAVVARLAEREMESARVVMRRLMWQLNEESGGIGWGCPEAMGEIMACHEGLAGEYAHVLLSYARNDGVFLDYKPLQRGVVWGLGRLGQESPHLLGDAVPHLVASLEAEDATLRGLAAWAIGTIGTHEARSRITPLLRDGAEVEVYLDRKLRICRVRDLAQQAMVELEP
ncbi:MAG: HEAT repeat domain-containing protein [Deltaproteobacteria bacterium]|nr:HEAT repeat domain-containing protein [Deltaproteobacteria bacterium]